MIGFRKYTLLQLTMLLLAVVITSAQADTIYVDASNVGLEDGSLANPWNTIQEGVTDALDGDTIMIAAGTYAAPVNIDARNNLTLSGADRTTTILEPTSLVDWNALGQTTGRKAAIRINASTNIDIQNLTIDMNIVKANNRQAILYANSSGDMDNIHVLNLNVADLSGGYSEIGIYVRAIAAPWTTANRAPIGLRNSILQNCGRVGIVMHDNVHVVIENCDIFKDESDFGYGMEIGSAASAEVRNSSIHGFYTRAASDCSFPSGIYVENAFTYTVVTPTPKVVTIEYCDIYDNACGLTIGNQFNGYAGDVDMVVNLNNNYIHDNDMIDPAGCLTGNETYGMIITDEDEDAGSSVVVNADSNIITNNGEYGIFHYGYGDSDITTNLTNNIISGHSVAGLVVAEYGSPAGSSHDVNLSGNSFTDNGTDVYHDPTYTTGTNIDSDGDYMEDPIVGGANVTNPLSEDPFAPGISNLALSDVDGLNSADPQAYTNSVTIDLDYVQTGYPAEELLYSEDAFATTNTLALFSGQTTATLALSAGDGPKTLHVKLRYLFKISDPVSDSITLDTQAPSSQVTGPTGTLNQPDPVINVVFSGSDAGPSGLQGVNLYYRRNSGSWTPYPGLHAASPIAFDTSTTGGDGTYEFYTVAVDNAGNEETDPAAPDAAPLAFNDTTSVGDWLHHE